jgi:hypothetical protein
MKTWRRIIPSMKIKDFWMSPVKKERKRMMASIFLRLVTIIIKIVEGAKRKGILWKMRVTS